MSKEVMPDKDGGKPPVVESKRLPDKAAAEALGEEFSLEYLAVNEPKKSTLPVETPVASSSSEAPTADAEADKAPRPYRLSIPRAQQFPAEGVWYETSGGKKFHVTKKKGDPYHINGPGIEGGSAISLKEIHVRAEAEKWQRIDNGGEQVRPEEEAPAAESKEAVSVKQNLERAQGLLRRWNELQHEYGRDRLLKVVKQARNNGPVPLMLDVENWLERHSTLASLRGQTNQEAQRFLTETALPDIEGVVRDVETNLEAIKAERMANRLSELEALSERLRATYDSLLSVAEKNPKISPEFQTRAHDIFAELTVMLEKEYPAYSQENDSDYQEHRMHIQSLIAELVRMKTELANGTIPERPEPTPAPSSEAGESGPLLEIGERREFERSIRRKLIRQKVERTAEGYYFFAEDGAREARPVDEAGAKKRLDGWKPIENEADKNLGPGFLEEGEIGEFTMDNSPAGSVRRFKREGGRYYQIRPEDGSIGKPYSEAEIQKLAREVGLKRVVPETPESIAEAARKAEALAALDAEVVRFRAEADAERSAYITKKEEQTATKKRLSRIFRDIGFGENLEEEVLDYKQYYENALTRWKNAELERLRHRGLDRDGLREAMAVVVREFEFEESERLYEGERKARLERTSKSVFERSDELWKESKAGISKEDGSMRVEVAWSRAKYVLGILGIGSQAGLEKAVKGIDGAGEWYNKHARGKHGKLILGATIVGAGAVAFGMGGTALVGVMATKRMAAGAGFAVTARGVMDRYAERGREKEKAEIMNEDRVKKVMRDVIIPTLDGRLEGKGEILNLEALSAYLDKEGIKKVQSKARKRRVSEVLRKGGSYVAGAAIGGLIPKEWFEGVSFGSAAHAATSGEGIQSTAEATPAPSAPASSPTLDTGSGATTVELKDAAGGPGPSPSAPSEGADTRTGVSAQDTGTEAAASRDQAPTLDSRMKGLTSTYTVRPGDSIWKIATKSVEGLPDMDKRSTGRFAKLLELKLQEKLTVIDPKLAEAAGFTADAEGRFTPDHIRAETKLELGKLLSSEEMAKLLEEAKSDNPIALPAASVPITEVVPSTAPSIEQPLIKVGVSYPGVDEAISGVDVADKIPDSVSADEKAAILDSFQDKPSAELLRPDGSVMKYIETLPREEQEKLFRNFKKLSVELFQTNEVMGSETYEMRYDPTVHPELAKTNVATILADHKLLGKNPFISYDRLRNPLHGSQMEEIAKFSKAVAKAFGPSVAAPKAVESVQEYILRMAAIAGNQGEKIPGFRMVN